MMICTTATNCFLSLSNWKVVVLFHIANHTCASHDFSCANGKACINMEWVCDKVDDCGDMSDEVNCSSSK